MRGCRVFAAEKTRDTLPRRYHGLLFAALNPPVGRTEVVVKLEESAHCGGADFPLATNRWASGAVAPEGYRNIESFRLDRTTPVWTFTFAGALLEKRVWMAQGENTTYVQYALLRGESAVELELKALVNYRDFHSLTHAGDWRMKIDPTPNGVRVTAFDGAVPFYLLCPQAQSDPQPICYRNLS